MLLFLLHVSYELYIYISYILSHLVDARMLTVPTARRFQPGSLISGRIRFNPAQTGGTLSQGFLERAKPSLYIRKYWLCLTVYFNRISNISFKIPMFVKFPHAVSSSL